MHLLVWECLCVIVCNCITCVGLCDHHHCSVTTKISTPLPLYSRIYPLPALIPDLWQPPICSLSLWFCHWGTLYKWSHAVCDFWDPPFHSASCPGDTPRSLWHQRMCVCVCVCVCEVTSVVSDSVTPWTSPPGSSVHGILQARILEWVAMPSSRGSSPPRDQTQVSYISCIGRWFFTTNATWEALGISGSFLFITELYSMAWMYVLWFI